jgi:hypothetical protein
MSKGLMANWHTSGEWIPFTRKGSRHGCCDCGLVHKMNIRIVRGRVEIQFIRDDITTAQSRRLFGFSVKPSKRKENRRG